MDISLIKKQFILVISAVMLMAVFSLPLGAQENKEQGPKKEPLPLDKSISVRMDLKVGDKKDLYVIEVPDPVWTSCMFSFQVCRNSLLIKVYRIMEAMCPIRIFPTSQSLLGIQFLRC